MSKLSRFPWQWLWWLPVVILAVIFVQRVMTPGMVPPEHTPAALRQELPVSGMALVSMGAEWCGACRALEPVVEAYAAAHPEVTYLKIDVDEHHHLAAQYQVSRIPAMLLFRNQKLVAYHVGGKGQQAIAKWVEEHHQADKITKGKL